MYFKKTFSAISLFIFLFSLNVEVALADSTVKSQKSSPVNSTITPNWSSDPYDIESDSTHQYITSRAISKLISDGKTMWHAWAYAYQAQIIQGNNDADEGSLLFADHFYDPDTGKNYLGSSTETAPNRCKEYFNTAVNLYNQGKTSQAMYNLGKALHFLQDMNNPHHASNHTYLNSNHVDYEDWVTWNQYRFNLSSSQMYNYAASAYNFAHKAAQEAKPFYSWVYNNGDKSDWDLTTQLNLNRALGTSAGLMGLFFATVGIPPTP